MSLIFTFHGIFRTLSLYRIDISGIVVQGVQNYFERYRNDFTRNFRDENFRCELYIRGLSGNGTVVLFETRRSFWSASDGSETVPKREHRNDTVADTPTFVIINARLPCYFMVILYAYKVFFFNFSEPFFSQNDTPYST